MNLLKGALLGCMMFSSVSLADTALESAVWCGTSSSSAPGAPWSIQILSSSASGSRLLLECPGFWAQPVLQDNQVRLRVQLPDLAGITTEAGQPELPALGRLLAIAADRDAEVIIHEISTQAFPCSNPYLAEPGGGSAGSPNWGVQQTGVFPSDWAEVFEPVILKDYRLAPVNIYPVRYDRDAQQWLLATRLEVEIRTTNPSAINVKGFFAPASPAFGPIYEASIDNLSEFNSATPLVGEGSRGKYQIIIADAFSTNLFLTNFITWKRQLGYQVILDSLSQTGSTKQQIKEAIMAEYYAGDAPLDYVLLVGDVTGPLAIPTFDIDKPGPGTEIDPTDLPYSLLEGQDYFPDVMIGRLSVSSAADLSTALSKVLAYQKNPYMTDPTWFKKALVVAGNYSDTPPAPITPAWTSLWLVDKLYDYGYAEVDTVIYWGPPQNPASGTQPIITSINSGVGLVAYRGWGDESGWQYPIFQNPNLLTVLNVFRLPVVISIVCETGNYRDDIDPCFGELWIRLGTPSNPIGGAACYAPSDLYTNTKWNNAIYAGFFEGLLEENLYRLGQSVLRSKLELYYGFPENVGTQDLVEFYFHTYNILGDPELPIWTDTPAQMALEIPDQLQPGKQQVTAKITNANGSPLGGAYVAFYKAGEVLEGAVADGGGYVSVEVDPLTAGQLIVTASKQNYLAKQDSVSIQVGDFPLGISGISTGGELAQAGQDLDLTVSIHNYGESSITDVQAVLTEADPFILIADSTATIAAITGAGTGLATFPISISETAVNGHVIEFTLRLNDATHSSEAKFILPVGGLQMIPAAINVESGSLEPGNTAQVRLAVCNIGVIPAQNVSGILTCASGAVSISTGEVSFPILQPNATAPGNATYTIQVQPDAATGQQVILELALTAAGSFAQTLNFPVQLGQPQTTDPLGPDSYGYYAYDDTDGDYAEAPVYNWIELDPEHGGTGATPYMMNDDSVEPIELPFTFKYYDLEYDSLSICSNGYVSFGVTWMAEFRNWNLPSALGPPSLIAAFWDDLKADTSGGNPTADIRVFTRYDQAEGRFIIEWSRTINRFRYEDPASWKVETFELVLFDPAEHQTATGDGEILFQYQEVNDVDDENNFATVGIEDEAHRRGLQYAYSADYPSAAAPLAANRAIKITTDPPGAYAGSSESAAPFAPTLDVPQPNPANPITTLRFSLPQAGRVTLDVYNTLGQRVATLVDAELPAGAHQVPFAGIEFASGIYVAVLRFQGAILTQKILILK